MIWFYYVHFSVCLRKNHFTGTRVYSYAEATCEIKWTMVEATAGWWQNDDRLSFSSPAERRSAGRRLPSCSSPHQTRTDTYRPQCSPLGPPYRETRAAGSPACSSGLRHRRRDQRWEGRGQTWKGQRHHNSVTVSLRKTISFYDNLRINKTKNLLQCCHVCYQHCANLKVLFPLSSEASFSSPLSPSAFNAGSKTLYIF